ncbi:Tigger transposable element-derived protein 1 [Dictyocoela muelleri]|nr:Tigger transposable element-derived protein 1 [Dictyocoela muelleri]
MLSQGRRILLLLDNAPVHCIDHNCKAIELLFLPPNCTSKIQPLDQGIIRSFKSNYRHFLLRSLNLLHEKNQDLDFEKLKSKFTLVQSLPIIIGSWSEVSSETILNYSNHALKNWATAEDILSDNDQDNMVAQSLESIDPESYYLQDVENTMETVDVTYDLDMQFLKTWQPK